MATERSAGAVIFRRFGKGILYLLLHYHFKTDYWDFPKGNIESGEAEEETVKREVKEETGIADIRFVPDFREKISYFYRRGGDTIFKEVIFYLAETGESEVRLSDEHTGYEWVGFEDAAKKLKENSRNVLMKADRFLRKFS